MMKRVFLTIIVIAIMVSCAESSTLQELITKFRARTGEVDSTASAFTNAEVTIWANLSMQKTVKIGGYVERRNDYVFNRDSAYYVLPSDFRNIKGLMLRSQYHAQWQTIFNNPLFSAPDTNVMQYTISRVNKDSAEIHLKFGTVGNAYDDIIYVEDSIVYPLPDKFEKMINVILISGNVYTRPFPNNYFLLDTNVNSYYDFKAENDSSWFYYKTGTSGGSSTDEDDTIRVFYERTAVDGDSIRVLYYAGVDDLATLADTTVITEDMETFIIDEMIAYYHLYQRFTQVYMNLIQLNRSDMGIEIRGREGANTNNPNQ